MMHSVNSILISGVLTDIFNVFDNEIDISLVRNGQSTLLFISQNLGLNF